MVQAEVLAVMRQFGDGWVEARDIAPQLNITPQVVQIAMRRLEKSNHLISQEYKHGCVTRVRFRVR